MTDVRKEIKAAQRIWLPWWAVLTCMAVSLPVILLFDHFGRMEMSLPTLNSVGVIGFILYLKWRLKRHAWFWIAMTMIAALHALLIWYVPWTKKWVPALAIGAIDSMDLCVILWAISAIERRIRIKLTGDAGT